MTKTEKTEASEIEDVGKKYEAALTDLPDRRRRFVEEYLIDLNATQAAFRAGYAEKGAHTEGWRLLRNAKVADAVRHGMADLSERAHLSQAWVREALKQNIRRAEVKDDTQSINRALQLLGQSLGMFSEDLNVNLNATTSAKVVMYFPDNGRGPKVEKGDGDQ